MELNYKDKAFIFKALSDETRLKIIDMLSCGELCACVILENFQITQPTLSYHMKFLTKSGVVEGRKESSWVYYSLNQEKVNQLKSFLDLVTIEKENCICNEEICNCTEVV